MCWRQVVFCSPNASKLNDSLLSKSYAWQILCLANPMLGKVLLISWNMWTEKYLRKNSHCAFIDIDTSYTAFLNFPNLFGKVSLVVYRLTPCGVYPPSEALWKTVFDTSRSSHMTLEKQNIGHFMFFSSCFKKMKYSILWGPAWQFTILPQVSVKL